VLKPTGVWLATLFLITPESTELIGRGHSSIALKPYASNCYVADPLFPETAVGIVELPFLQWCVASGLSPQLPIRYGSWCGRKEHMSYQDIVLLSTERCTG
jgi:hypothetical protein